MSFLPVATSTGVDGDGDDSSRGRGAKDRRRVPRSVLVFRSDATFPAVRDGASLARRWCQQSLREWGATLDPTPVLSVCEDLVAFASYYETGEIHVALSSGPARVAIWVTATELLPERRAGSEPSEHLQRVDEIASSWGVRQSPDGRTTIWADVAV
jgi:hypothetical protein